MSTEPNDLGLESASRRRLLGTAGAIGAAVVMTPKLLIATSEAKAANTAAIGVSGSEQVPAMASDIPAIGMGSFMTFDLLDTQPRDHLREVIRRFHAHGGRLIDTSPLYGNAEVVVGNITQELGVDADLFLANKIWVTGEYLNDYSHGYRSIEQSLHRLGRKHMDLMQVHSLTNVEMMMPFLQKLKSEGKVGRIGVTHHDPRYFDLLAWWVENGPVDFVQVHYSIHTRQAENRVLAAAKERGITVIANMPLEKARLHEAVRGHALPAFAEEIQVANWAQFFLKWVISNPAISYAIPATTNPIHMDENMGALVGPLPDAKMRARMVRHMETIPAFAKVGTMPMYPGKRFSGLVKLNP